MKNGKTFLAIIPARGGSKRLPKKNVLELHGKPLIAWSIEAGLRSKLIDKLIVTSDDENILNISKTFGSEIIKRPKNLSIDTSTTTEVIIHVLDNFKEYNYIVLLQPTSPLRTHVHIDEAIELLLNKNADAIISVCPSDHPIDWYFILPENSSLSNFTSKLSENKRSQDLPNYYRLNGAIYICKTSRFLKENTMLPKDNIYAYIMSKATSIDIDDEFDFKLAEFLIYHYSV